MDVTQNVVEKETEQEQHHDESQEDDNEKQKTEDDQHEVKSKENDSEIIPGAHNDPFRRYRITKQVCLVLVWICIGLYAEIVGPTLPDLKDKIGVNYEEISRALVGKSFGLMFGSIIGGFLHESFYRKTDLLIAIGLFLASLATIITPFSVSVGMAFGAFFINGFAEGLINTGGNTMVMHLWGANAASPMHSLHFGFGFGALLAPQIARPFLGEEQNETDSFNMDHHHPVLFNSSSDTGVKEARIEIPYGIIAAIIGTFGFVILYFYIKGPPPGFPVRKNIANFRNMISPGSCVGGKALFGLQLFACLWLYFIQAVGGERAMGKFLFSFAIESDDLNIPRSRATTLQSSFWLSFTTGRALGILVTKIMPLNAVIIGDVIGNLVAAVVLSIWGSSNESVLWTFVCIQGLFIAVAFPNGMSWANLHMDMNSVGVMVLMVGGSFGGLIYQLSTGSLFENEGPQTLMYVMVFYAGMLGVSFLLMQVVVKLNGRSSNKVDSISVNEDTDVEMVKAF